MVDGNCRCILDNDDDDVITGTNGSDFDAGQMEYTSHLTSKTDVDAEPIEVAREEPNDEMAMVLLAWVLIDVFMAISARVIRYDRFPIRTTFWKYLGACNHVRYVCRWEDKAGCKGVTSGERRRRSSRPSRIWKMRVISSRPPKRASRC